jgi:hypothetical protein
MLRGMALVRTDVSEELRAYIIRVTRIGSPIPITLMMEVVSSSETSIVLQEPHSVTSQKTPFFKFIYAIVF